MTDRDTFAAAALTGLLARGLLQSNLLAADAYKVADAMLRERAKTNHDAAPAARASGESVVPQPTPRGDSDRTDKAAPRPSEGTGDTDHGASPEAIASVGRPRTDKADLPTRAGTGDTPDSPKPIKGGVSDRSKPINGPDPDSRVWETPVHTPATHATRGEGSVRREGTEPAAWATFYPNGSTASVYVGRQPQHAEPLYRHPPCQDSSQKNLTLTDCERGAIERAVDSIASTMPYESQQGLADWKTLRGLLERLGGGR